MTNKLSNWYELLISSIITSNIYSSLKTYCFMTIITNCKTNKDNDFQKKHKKRL